MIICVTLGKPLLSEPQFSSSVNMRGLGYYVILKRVLPALNCQASEIGTDSFSGNLGFESDLGGLAMKHQKNLFIQQNFMGIN